MDDQKFSCRRTAPRRGVQGLLDAISDLSRLVLGGLIADIWVREGQRWGIPARQISAEDWRSGFFRPREQEGRDRSKSTADALARRVIEWSGAARPTSLRHDAAEAILIGLWGILDAGRLEVIARSIRLKPRPRVFP